MFLNEVTVLVPVLNEAKHSFALYTPERTRQRWPVRLAATTEQDMNDWVSGRGVLEGLVRRDLHPGLSLPSSDQLCPHVSSPCSAYPAVRAGGSMDARPHRPSGLSLARVTSL